MLALAETVVALTASGRAPSDADWRAAAAEVRAGFRPGDLIVAAPAWADPVMRLHLGDLVPAAVAGRMDAARFGRVWEIAQRGARSSDAAVGTVLSTQRHGALTVRRVERPRREVTYDFLERWRQARVARVELGRGEIPCPAGPDRFQCPNIGFNYVTVQTLEVDGGLRRAVLAQPVAGAVVAVEWSDVLLGRELAVGAGLHNVWHRKTSDGVVNLNVLVDGKPVLAVASDSDSGWTLARADTAPHAGRRATVRFEVMSAKPYARHFAFAAEARL